MVLLRKDIYSANDVTKLSCIIEVSGIARNTKVASHLSEQGVV